KQLAKRDVASRTAASCPGPRERLRAPRTSFVRQRAARRGGGPAGPTTRRGPRRRGAKRREAPKGPRSPALDKRGRTACTAIANLDLERLARAFHRGLDCRTLRPR